MSMMKNEIERALTAAAGHHVGAKVPAQGRGVTQTMREMGLIGPDNGLTRQGSIAAEKLKSAELDRLFG